MYSKITQKEVLTMYPMLTQVNKFHKIYKLDDPYTR